LCGYPHKNQRGLELKIILSIADDEEPKILIKMLLFFDFNDSIICTLEQTLCSATAAAADVASSTAQAEQAVKTAA
jgi:hypothetical protein